MKNTHFSDKGFSSKAHIHTHAHRIKRHHPFTKCTITVTQIVLSYAALYFIIIKSVSSVANQDVKQLINLYKPVT